MSIRARDNPGVNCVMAVAELARRVSRCVPVRSLCRPSSLVLPAVLTSLLAAGCSGIPLTKPKPSGGYYGGDAPPASLPVDPDSVPDAVPRHEPLSATGNKPYTALGKRYRPLASATGFVQRGTASWYGSKFQGRRTSSGEPYDMFAMTAAHPVLPLPSYVRVTNLDNGRSVVVKVNDRGPFLHDRIIDLSYVAAHKLDIARHGTGSVEVRVINPDAQEADGGTASPANTTGEIVIQVGAYAKRDNARSMRQLLQRAGYQVAPLVDNLVGGEQWLYRVRVGPFPSRAAARTARQKLESLLGRPVAVVVQ